MTNDTRQTISKGDNFYRLVKELFDNKQKAAILYEDNGATRANGMITDMFEKEGRHWMKLNDEIEIAIDKLYAVNGTFSSDYSEC